MTATHDQWKAPVADGWTWVAYDLWQVPRRERAIIGTGAFMQGGAAATVAAGGAIWQDVPVPAAGAYRVFLRVANFGDGINRVRVECGNVSHSLEWGSAWPRLNSASVLRRFRSVQSLLNWTEVGAFDLPAGAQRLSIAADRADQSCLFVDAIYLTDDSAEETPTGWNPLARPAPKSAPVKRRRTMVPDEAIAAARENVQRYQWAREQADAIVKKARTYADRSDGAIWDLMPASALGRAESFSASIVGCPVHGRSIETRGGWQLDPFNRPYEVHCPIGGESYASAPYYCHQVYREHVRPACELLGRAYAITGDRVFARKSAILLCRVALEYPNGWDKRDRAFEAPYSSSSGTILNRVWAGDDLSTFSTAYDLVFDTINQDPSLVSFVRGKVPAVESAADLRWFVEERLLRTMAQAAIDGAIRGNPGTFEAGLAAVALCLDDFDSGRYPDSHEIIRSAYYDQPAWDSAWSIPKRYLNNLLHPNGCTDSSVDYGSLVQSLVDFGEHVETLRALHPDRLPQDAFPNVLANPRLRRHIDFLTDVVCLSRYHPALGDGHGKKLWDGDNLRPIQQPPAIATLAYPAVIDRLFRAAPDAGLARLLADQGALDGTMHRDLFDRPRDDEIESSVRTAPARRTLSSLLDDHGVVLLRAGSGDDERVVTLNYRGCIVDHRHADAFAIGLFGCGLDLLPELPYIGSIDFSRMNNFERHPLLHNTVTFDRGFEADGPSYLTRLHEAHDISFVTARTPTRQGNARFVERTCALVTVDEHRWYVVDLIDAAGGREHHVSLHGPIAKDVTVDGVDPQAERAALEHPGGVHPFAFMTNVSNGATNGTYSVTYRLGDADGVQLRVWGAAPSDTMLMLADARTPLDPGAYAVRYAFAHRAGPAPLQSRFVHVFEATRGAGFIKGVDIADGKIRIALDDRVDTIDPVAVFRSVSSNAVSGTIADVDRAADTIRIDGVPAGSALEGAAIRIYNDERSRMYRVTAVVRDRDGAIHAELDRSGLVAEGVALGFRDGVALNSVLMPFVTTGCTLEARDGRFRWRVLGKDRVGHNGTDLLVASPDGSRPTQQQLEKDFRSGREFAVYGYAPFDRFEILDVHQPRAT